MAVDVEHAPSLLPILDENKPDRAEMTPRYIAMGALALLFVVLPYAPFWNPDWISYGVIFAIVGLSVNVLIGYAGQVSLGHNAFVGVGAFASALLVSKAGLIFWLALPLAALSGAITALLLGFVALRLAGLFLALITLAYGAVAQGVIFEIRNVTGGAAGALAPRPAGFTGEHAYVYLCIAIFGLVVYIDWRMMKTKVGRAILAIRDNEIAAASFGINVVGYKLLAFVISGASAGLAGALMAHRITRVSPTDFDFTLALTFVLMTAVGGLGSRAGIFIASFIFAILPLWFNSLTVWVLIIGPLLLLLTLTFFPGGLGQQFRPITDWLNGKSFSMKRGDAGVQSGGAGVRP
ncbi:MAG: branched-chain amino acid ABC transporter permease [Actinomycetota bacterium]